MNPEPRPRTHDKEGRQRALLDAAIAVFSERGYDAATTREVAERAGVSEGLIHRYFAGKHGLLLAALTDRYHEVAEDLIANLDGATTVQEEIECMVTWPPDAMLQKQDFMRVSISQAILDPSIGQVLSEYVNEIRVTLMADRLRVHQEAGRIRADVDVEALAGAIAGYTLAAGFFSQVVFGMDRDFVREQTLQTAAILCHGIFPHPTPAGDGA